MGNSITACIDTESDNTKLSIINISPTPDSTKSENNNGTMSQLLWEFQRFNKELGWGGLQNFETGDLGRWSNESEDVFGETLASVAPPVPTGYSIEQNWSIVVKKRIRHVKKCDGGDVDETGITDRFGWHYCQSFKSNAWSDVHKTGYNVRRRGWRRVLKEKPSSLANVSHDR
mmetsp:Transcript_2827/g.2987  ORF Transcript_2827/g.2987 Transcript_2827/m.2987 type:complete len:173 (-) Transcript_2827:68-586(-)